MSKLDTSRRVDETDFRAIVRAVIADGRYPQHRQIVVRMGRGFERGAFGLSEAQGRWRREEVEAAGYDWDASRVVRKLVRKGRHKTSSGRI